MIRSPPRVAELDGLRGLGAFAVFGTHAVDTIGNLHLAISLRYFPLGILWSGAQAVILFFVLSGLVLALPFFGRKEEISYARFYQHFLLLRLFRIYPAYWFALLFSLAAMIIFAPAGMSGNSSWAQEAWRTLPSGIAVSQYIRHFLVVLSFNFHLINPPTWSLIVEMRMSLLMPFMIVAFRDWGDGYRSAVLLLLTLPPAIALPQLQYLPMFAMGVALARHWHFLTGAMSGAGNGLLFVMSAIAIAAYYNSGFGAIFHTAPAANLVTAAGAALIMLIVVSSKSVSSLLTCGPMLLFGRISYSFYLLHFPIWIVLVSRLYPLTHSLLPIVPIALTVTCLASLLSYWFIEDPVIRFSRRMAAALPPFQSASCAHSPE